jgi:hypothetical protein
MKRFTTAVLLLCIVSTSGATEISAPKEDPEIAATHGWKQHHQKSLETFAQLWQKKAVCKNERAPWTCIPDGESIITAAGRLSARLKQYVGQYPEARMAHAAALYARGLDLVAVAMRVRNDAFRAVRRGDYAAAGAQLSDSNTLAAEGSDLIVSSRDALTQIVKDYTAAPKQ